jgi:competence protein ComEA
MPTSDGDELRDGARAAPAALEPSAGRHPLRPAHLAVVVLVTAAALVGTMLVLASAQPSTEQVDLPGAEAVAAPAGPSVAEVDMQPSPPMAPGSPGPSDGQPSPPAVEPRPSAEVVVHVAGKVRRPGVVRLPAGSRVIDAVEAAGGAVPAARLASLNLARVLTDGEQVRVGLAPAEPTGGLSDLVPGTGVGAGEDGVTVDLNRASAAELEELPGVGPVLAGRIVSYRDENGPFRSIDQLIEVPGIGPAVLSGLADRARI